MKYHTCLDGECADGAEVTCVGLEILCVVFLADWGVAGSLRLPPAPPDVLQKKQPTLEQRFAKISVLATTYEYTLWIHRNWTNRFKKNTQQVKHLWTEIRIEIGYQVIRFDFTITSMMLIWFHHTSKLSSMEKSLTGKQMISTTQMKKWPRDSATFCIGKLFWIECLTARHTGGYFSEDPAFSGYLPNVSLENWFFYVWFFEFSQNSLFLILKNALGFLRKISWRKKLVIILG